MSAAGEPRDPVVEAQHRRRGLAVLAVADKLQAKYPARAAELRRAANDIIGDAFPLPRSADEIIGEAPFDFSGSSP